MIKRVSLGKEVVVLAKNEVGVLSKVASALADRGINMTALSAQAAGGVALMNFTVDEHLRACDLLRKKKFSVEENPVLILEVENKPGVLRQITRKLASARIDILNVYGSTPAPYGVCTLVLSTSSNTRALVVLKRGK